MTRIYNFISEKITLLLFAVASITAFQAMGQTPVANLTCGYAYGNTPAPSWSSILNGAGTQVIASGTSIDDQNYMSNAFPAGFTFDFNGTIYSSFNISANGFIFFGNTDPGVITNPISNATVAYTGAISALGANIQAHDDATNTPQIMVQYSGTAPNRVATIEWMAFKPQGNTGGFCGILGGDWNMYDFQIKLYENGGATSNVIDIIHKDQNPVCINSNGLSAQVGLRGATNADFRNRARTGNTNNSNTTEGTSNTDVISHGGNNYFNANTRMRYTPKIQPAGISGEAELCVGEGGTTLAEANNGAIAGATYQWYSSPANTPIGGAVNSTYAINPGLGSTSYYVVVSNTDGCVRVSQPYTVVVTDCGNPSITVTVNVGSNGTSSPSGTTTYNAGDTPTYTFTPACGYEVASIIVNGSPVAVASSYTFPPLAASATIYVSFSLKAEVCNGIDDDCDGIIDNVLVLAECQVCQNGNLQTLPTLTWYQDNDGDGHGNAAVSVQNCIQPVGYVSNNTDCDDTNANITNVCMFTITSTTGSNGTISPLGATSVASGSSQLYNITPACGYEVADVLVNGSSVGAVTSYTFTNVQSNQTISVTFALKAEVCNGIDDDCDGIIDNVPNLAACEVCQNGNLQTLPTLTWYQDSDGDGFGNANVSVTNCIQPVGYVSNNTDCDDTDNTITNTCLVIITSSAGNGGTISPLGETSVEEGSSQQYNITPACGYEIVDVLVNGNSVGAVMSYTFTNVQSNQTISVTFALKAEVCNGIDDDCDGIIDNVPNLTECQTCQNGILTELPVNTWYEDADGDGHGYINSTITSCVQPEGFVNSSNDCNDGDQLVWLAKPAEITMTLNPNHVCITDAPFALGTVSPANGTWGGTGVSNGTFSPVVAGVGSHTLTYTVLADGACVLQASSSATMTVDLCNSIDENEKGKITIYPSHTSGIINLIGIGLTSASVMDMSGRQVETFSLTGDRMIDISTHPTGMYLIRIDGDYGSVVLKVIKVE